MASVRLGKDSRAKIAEKAKAAFDTANQRPDLPAQIKETIWQAIENHPAQRAIKEFVSTFGVEAKRIYDQSFDERSIVGCVWVSDRRQKNDWHISFESIDFKLATPRKLYGSYSYSRDEMWRFTIDELHFSSEQERFLVLTELEKCKEERKTFHDQKVNYSLQIGRLLDSCNTLKQLLDAQPSMKEFVEPAMLQELHKKVTRESQARERREIANIDTDLLNKVVLTSKLVS